MKYIISGKNIEITDALREKVIKQLGKLDKFFHSQVEARVTLSTQKTRQIVEVTIPSNGIIMRAEVADEDMYVAIDRIKEVLERQIRKYKTKLSKKTKGATIRVEEINEMSDVEEEFEFRIVRSKKFPLKPMNVDEAILQMNLLSHEFFIFVNSETKVVNVVYKRKNGNYGLIEPE